MDTEVKKVEGVLWAGNKRYYAVGWTQLCDDSGKEMPGLWGCLATPMFPETTWFPVILEDEQVYDLPVLIINGVFISRSANDPQYINVIRRFDWDNLEEPDDIVKSLMNEMSLDSQLTDFNDTDKEK